jgi:DNA polymerase
MSSLLEIFWDVEARSAISLTEAGPWRFASDATTEVLCISYAIGDGEPETWVPDQPVPQCFVDAATDPRWLLVAHNDAFERAIERRLLGPRFNWPRIPLGQRRDTMSIALAAALPGSLDKCAATLGLPVRKDPAAHRAMLQMVRPRRPRKGELPGLYWHDTPELRGLVSDRNKRDVVMTREIWRRLPALVSSEQTLWELDAEINDRGVFCDRALVEAAREVVQQEQDAIDQEIASLTQGKVTTVNQVVRIKAFLQERGHALKTLGKRSVSAALAHDPEDDVRRLLELRRDGSRAAVRKLDAFLAGIEDDGRLRGTLKFHAAGPGRWSSSRVQLQNLVKPKIDVGAAINAVLGGDMERIRALGAPLDVVADIMRAIVCAAPDHELHVGDYGAVESRAVAWLAGERWKIETYRKYDETRDPQFEPYCVLASQALQRKVTPDDEVGRQFGKTYDLAFGFGGGLGAWRRFDTSDTYTDGQVEEFKSLFRRNHKATVRFWRDLENGLKRALHTRQHIQVGKVACEVENGTLYTVLPSGRRIAYPHARLGSGKFDGTYQIYFHDNARGGWTEIAAWHGLFTENVVQATCRDLLAAALVRLEARGYRPVLHCHDEVVVEVPKGVGTRDEFLQILLEPPGWASGLPLAAKAWTNVRYVKPTATPTRPVEISPPAKVEPGLNGSSSTAATPAVAVDDHLASGVREDRVDDAREAVDYRGIPLPDLIGEPLVDGKLSCPFHADNRPSLQIYDDHFHCFGCGAHGDQLDWLTRVDGLTREEALNRLAAWEGPTQPSETRMDSDSAASALRLWDEAQPITGTLAARYLAETRYIDLSAMPVNVDEVLRFHPRCPFGPGARHPCLLALMRGVTTDAPTGIHRIALTPDGRKIDRKMLGRSGAVKLWSAGSTLVVGEGIESVLAAATRVPYRSALLQPAWAALSAGAINRFPVIDGIEQLILLVDHDRNGTGQAAASSCADRWSRAGRRVIRLTPKCPGADFNDIIQPEAVL